MSKALDLLELLDTESVVVALHNTGRKVLGKYYSNVDIFGFELWEVPLNDPLLSNATVSHNPYELYANMVKLSKPKLRKYNPTKQRIGIQRYRAENIIIPDKVWIRLNIEEPTDYQTLLMQCLVILYKQHNVKIFGLENSQPIKDFK